MAPGLWASVWAPEDMDPPKPKVVSPPAVSMITPPKHVYQLDWLLASRPQRSALVVQAGPNERVTTSDLDAREAEIDENVPNICQELDKALLVLRLLIKAKKEDALLVGSLKLVETTVDKARNSIDGTMNLSKMSDLKPVSLKSLTSNLSQSGIQGLKERNLNIPYEEDLPDTKLFECGICKTGKKYSLRSKLIHHLETKHFYCEKCDSTYSTREELINHLAINKERHNFCKSCLLDFQTPEAYVGHLDKEHKSQNHPPACPGCGLKCDEAFEIVRHLENDLCPSIPLIDFNRARTITALIQRHSLGPFKNLTAAEQTVVKEQSLKLLRGDECIVAGLPLVKQSAWSPFFNNAAHMQQSLIGATWKCPYHRCGRLFDQFQNFSDHLRAGHFTYGICPGCYKQFESIHGLFQHITTGQRNCKVSKHSAFPHAIAAVSGGYIQTEARDNLGNWSFVAGSAPCADLYVHLPQVSGKK